MIFFENVKKLCKEKGLTIESVANKAGLTIDSYNSYKRHENLPRADIATKIADILGTSVEYLVTGEEKKELTVEEANFIYKMRSLPEKDRNTILSLLDLLKKQEENENKGVWQMKLKKYLILVFLLATTRAFSFNSSMKQTTTLNYTETNIQKLNLTANENLILLKLNSLKTTNKETLLLVLDSLYKKNTEKKFVIEKQEDSED